MGRMNRKNDGIVHEAMNCNVQELRRRELLDALRSGYEAMGAINLQFAESIQEHDLNQLEQYESILAMGRD